MKNSKQFVCLSSNASHWHHCENYDTEL